MRRTLAIIALCALSITACSEKPATGMPSVLRSPGDNSYLAWPEKYAVTCEVSGKTVIRESWVKVTAPDAGFAVVISSMNGEERMREDFQIPGPGSEKKHLKSIDGWVSYDGDVSVDRVKFRDDFPASFGMSLEEWAQCVSSATPLQ